MSKKKYDDDSGFTVADMNVEGMQGYIPPEHLKQVKEIQKLKLTKKEQRAFFWGSFLALIPPLLISLICFTLTGVLLYLWLT